jgi:glycosyltransferase involved in cell wall biosynthesis
MDIWFDKMTPDHIKPHVVRLPRVSREEALVRMGAARVMLAPSLSDGVPNAMMEAMALGAVPIVSPLETITPVVKAEENVLFARNLYVDEIAGALVRAMNDDRLADDIARRNLPLVEDLADRARLKPRVAAYYAQIAAAAGPGAPG